MAKYRCKVCGQIIEIPDGEDIVCPVCHASGDNLVLYLLSCSSVVFSAS